MKKPTPEQLEENPEVKSMMEDLGTITAISAVGLSEGGKILVSSLVKDVVGIVDILCSQYHKLTQNEFISYCADMNSKLDLVRAITRSQRNKQDLESIIADTIKE